MVWCDRGVQMLLTTVGAFAAFSLMAIAIGTDYWLYSSAHICNGTNITTDDTQGPPKKARGDLTHSGLWRICCLEGTGGRAVTVGGSNFLGAAAVHGAHGQSSAGAAPPSRTRPRRRMALPWQPASPRLPWERAAGCGARPGGAVPVGRPPLLQPVPMGCRDLGGCMHFGGSESFRALHASRQETSQALASGVRGFSRSSLVGQWEAKFLLHILRGTGNTLEDVAAVLVLQRGLGMT